MLKDFIQKNRESFDQGPLPDGHTKRFADRLQAQRGKSIVIPVRRIWQAAAAVLIILIAVQAGSKISTQSPSPVSQISPQVVSELSDIELYYGNLVRKESLEVAGKWEQEETMQFFMDDLEILENEYKSLKNNILEEGRNEYLIDALIRNFQQRLSILQHISTSIKQDKTNDEREQLQSS